MRTMLAAMIVGLSLEAGAAPDDAAKKDLGQMQGEWSMVSFEFDGRPSTPEDEELKTKAALNKLTQGMAAELNTLVVSWKDAADRNESVASEALVIPSRVLFPSAGVPPSAMTLAFSSSKS